MKKNILSLLFIVCCTLSQLSAQKVATLGLQWSSSRLSYNIPFEGFNMGSELSTFGYLSWGRYLIVAPEIGLRQQDRSFTPINLNLLRHRFRSVHVKMSMLFPFSKSYREQNHGWFATIGFSQNLRFNIYEEEWSNGELVSVVNFAGGGSEGDLHIGLGYMRPISEVLQLSIRGEYAEGTLGQIEFRRNELSLAVGLGFQLGRN